MADDTKFDIAMLFKLNGEAVWGEAAMDVNPNDKLMKDFVPIAGYQYYSNFFQLKGFNFKMELRPDEDDVGSLSKPGGQHAAKGGPTVAGQEETESLFDRWRSASNSEYKKIFFPLEFDTFSFTRVIDGASPIFFEACANQLSFDSAVMVKRLAVGQRQGVNVASLAFMRLEFTDIMLKSVSWQDGDLVTESVSFTCKKMRLRYRQQDDSGGLLSETAPADWVRDRDAQMIRRG